MEGFGFYWCFMNAYMGDGILEDKDSEDKTYYIHVRVHT